MRRNIDKMSEREMRVKLKELSKFDTPDARHAINNPQHIADLIEHIGLTQEELAKRLGVDPRSIRRYRARGAPYPVQYCLEQLARY